MIIQSKLVLLFTVTKSSYKKIGGCVEGNKKTTSILSLKKHLNVAAIFRPYKKVLYELTWSQAEYRNKIKTSCWLINVYDSGYVDNICWSFERLSKVDMLGYFAVFYRWASSEWVAAQKTWRIITQLMRACVAAMQLYTGLWLGTSAVEF